MCFGGRKWTESTSEFPVNSNIAVDMSEQAGNCVRGRYHDNRVRRQCGEVLLGGGIKSFVCRYDGHKTIAEKYTFSWIQTIQTERNVSKSDGSSSFSIPHLGIMIKTFTEIPQYFFGYLIQREKLLYG